MLNFYLSQTQQLLSNPLAPSTLYSTSQLQQYINTARTQLAGETGCCRFSPTLTTTGGTNYYTFEDFVPALPSSLVGVYDIRQMWVNSGTGQIYLGSRPFPWAALYWLNNVAPVQAIPTEWSQYTPGSNQVNAVGLAEGGSFYVNPTPDTTYTLTADACCIPFTLSQDTDPEAIPYPYTDAVPFYAAYYAYMSAQRQSDADMMYKRYEEFIGRAKKASVPNVLSRQYDQNMGGGGGLPVGGGG